MQEVQVLSRWHITVCNYNFRISAWILNATRCRDVGRGRSVNLPISARGPYYAHHLGQWTLTLPTTLLFAPPTSLRFLNGATVHSIRFWVFLSNNSKSVQNDLWLFQLFLVFFNSLYQELSGYVSQMSLVLHIYP